MISFLDLALQYAARGLYVLPLKPRDKFPIIPKAEGGSGYKDATIDPVLITQWWTRWPNANIGIACGASNKCVMDCDHGFKTYDDFISWRDRNGIPVTYTVRSGRRVSKEDGVTPVFNVQMYFDGAIACNGRFELDGVSGEIRSAGALVVAVGSIHPDSGEAYEVLIDAPIVHRPPQVEQSVTRAKNAEVERKPGEKIKEGRNNALVSEIGKFRHRNPGVSQSITLAAMLAWNDESCDPPLDTEEVQDTLRKQFRLYEDVQETANLIVGRKEQKPITDWRERYHTFDEMHNAPDPTFIIEGFIQKDVITAIAAPVGQRKTIIAANVVHASITGEPLFDYFKVTHKPERVLYLCPEMGLYSFAKRIRNLGLMDYVGKTLFCWTMNSEGKLSLSDLTNEELAGALVVVDTAVRFVEGDENSSEDMKVFAEDCFRLMRAGASAVLVLFHSPKETKNASELTLENAMRGSGDLGAFVSSCWATRLQDNDEPWESESYLKNVKQRDFESDPFTVKSDKLGRLHMVSKPGDNAKLSTKPTGPKADKDGKDDARLDFLRKNPQLSDREAAAVLKKLKMGRSHQWVHGKRKDIEAEDKGITYHTGELTVGTEG